LAVAYCEEDDEQIFVNIGVFLYHLMIFNPLNPELNPICCLLALLGDHHFLHVSRIRVKVVPMPDLKACEGNRSMATLRLS
jgi:transposase